MDPSKVYFVQKRGIVIYPQLLGRGRMRVIINNNGKETIGQEIHDNESFCKKQLELYAEIYEKLIQKEKNETNKI